MAKERTVTAKDIIRGADRCAPKKLVKAYRNLNIRDHVAYSVMDRKTGKVIAHEPVVVVSQARLLVSESGRQRVLREKRRNVHAFAEGCWEYPADPPHETEKIRYNPYLFGSFVRASDEHPVHEADYVVLDAEGARARRPR